MLIIPKFQLYTPEENSAWYYALIIKSDGLSYITFFKRQETQVLKCSSFV